MAVLSKPVVLLKNASSPRTVFRIVKQPSWQAPRACGESASHPRAMRRNARKGERFIKFLNGRVIVFMRRVLKTSSQLGKMNWEAVIRVYYEARQRD